MEATQKHYRTCNLCEAMCGLEITHQNQKLISIKGDKAAVLSRGHICPKATALEDLHFDKDRLKTPIKRTKSGWIALSWEDAFDEVAHNLRDIQKKYGQDSVATYQGNPSVHNIGTMLFSSDFIKSIASTQRYSATSVDQLPHHFASLMMFGHYLMFPIPDIDHTDFMLIMGGNPAVSNGSIMTAPDFSNRLKAIQKRGGKVAVVDPRLTETAQIADDYYAVNPGSDALLLLALIQVIFDKHLAQPKHLKTILKGYENLQIITKHYTPERISEAVGLSAKVISDLACQFATSKTAVCYGRVGLSMQAFGGLCQWLVNCLNCITGNLDAIGGALFTLPAIDVVGSAKQTGKTGSFNKRQTRVDKLPEFTGEFPVVALADEILTPGNGQVKALVSIAGNPVLSTPNGTKLEQALESLEFMAAIDIYLNETTKHANIILPPTTGLETSIYDLVFHQFAIKNTVAYAPALFEKEPNQRHDWEIFKALTARLSGKENPLNLEQTLDYLLQFSYYNEPKLSVKELLKHPHGIDFGNLKPQLPGRLFTSDKKIDLIPDLLVADLKRLDKILSVKANKTYPFYLIGRRQLRSNNSWMHNSERLSKGKNRCTLLINSDDAKILKLFNGQKACVSSNVGSLTIEIETTSKIKRGVVSIPHGWGHHRKETKLSIAQKNAGVSLNDLTDKNRIDALTGNADFSGTRVRIEPIN